MNLEAICSGDSWLDLALQMHRTMWGEIACRGGYAGVTLVGGGAEGSPRAPWCISHRPGSFHIGVRTQIPCPLFPLFNSLLTQEYKDSDFLVAYRQTDNLGQTQQMLSPILLQSLM